MKIDLDLLEKAIVEVYAREAERIDKNTKNDNAAIKRLTASETRMLKDTNTISMIKELAERIEKLIPENDKSDYESMIVDN